MTLALDFSVLKAFVYCFRYYASLSSRGPLSIDQCSRSFYTAVLLVFQAWNLSQRCFPFIILFIKMRLLSAAQNISTSEAEWSTRATVLMRFLATLRKIESSEDTSHSLAQEFHSQLFIILLPSFIFCSSFLLSYHFICSQCSSLPILTHSPFSVGVSWCLTNPAFCFCVWLTVSLQAFFLSLFMSCVLHVCCLFLSF